MVESTQHKLDRIRPPRVHITYDVEVGNAIQKKELPFVAGIMADLSGKPEVPLPKLRERKFVEIDRDNFNEVLASIEPRLALRVNNRLSKENGHIPVVLKFTHIDDFSPVKVLSQVEPLRKLYEARQRLSDLVTKLDGNDDLDQKLQEIMNDQTRLKELKDMVAQASSGSNGNPQGTDDVEKEGKKSETGDTES
jgi:type VI secretion system protein ImpB